MLSFLVNKGYRETDLIPENFASNKNLNDPLKIKILSNSFSLMSFNNLKKPNQPSCLPELFLFRSK